MSGALVSVSKQGGRTVAVEEGAGQKARRERRSLVSAFSSQTAGGSVTKSSDNLACCIVFYLKMVVWELFLSAF